MHPSARESHSPFSGERGAETALMLTTDSMIYAGNRDSLILSCIEKNLSPWGCDHRVSIGNIPQRRIACGLNPDDKPLHLDGTASHEKLPVRGAGGERKSRRNEEQPDVPVRKDLYNRREPDVIADDDRCGPPVRLKRSKGVSGKNDIGFPDRRSAGQAAVKEMYLVVGILAAVGKGRIEESHAPFPGHGAGNDHRSRAGPPSPLSGTTDAQSAAQIDAGSWGDEHRQDDDLPSAGSVDHAEAFEMFSSISYLSDLAQINCHRIHEIASYALNLFGNAYPVITDRDISIQKRVNVACRASREDW